MAMWRYTGEGGEHTIDEGELKTRIHDGKLPGHTRLFCIDDERWYRVDVDFASELSAAAYRAGQRAAQEAKVRQGFLMRHRRAILPLAVLLAWGGWYWWSSRVTCSSDDVKRIVTRLVMEKLLKLTSGDVNLVNIATLGSLDSGGAKCSADVEVTG